MTSPETGDEAAAPVGPTAPGVSSEDVRRDALAPSAPAPAVPAGPPSLEQSAEDTDAGWGEYPESARDRLYRDRPPHWADH